MQIVVLVKPVPDPASGGERLGPDDWRLDRAAVAGRRQRQRRVRARGGAQADRGARRRGHAGLDGAAERAPTRCARRSRWAPRAGILVTDDALAGSDTLSTARVLAAALKDIEFDLVLAGADTSDGWRRGRSGRCRGAARPAVPVLRGEDRAGPGGRHGPGPPDQPDRLRGARGADAGAHRRDPGPRRAALPVAQGDHGRPLQGDRDEGTGRRRRRRGAGRRRGRDDEGPRVGGAAAARGDTRRPGAPDEAARQIVAFLAERRII